LLRLRQLTLEDLEVAREIASLAYRRPFARALFERYLRLQPDGWLLAEIDGQALGIGGVTSYGKYAVIGTMATRPSAQRQGVASEILARLLDLAASWSCPLVGLDATDDGLPVYLRHGFVVVDRSLELTRQPGKRFTASSRVEIARKVDISEIVELDSSVFGASRRRLLELLLEAQPASGYVVRDAYGRMGGYVLVQADRLGPAVASNPGDAESLLRAALSSVMKRDLTVLVPAANQAVLEVFARYGFTVKRDLAHMRRGRDLDLGDRTRLMALAGFGLG
jgi:GNAT superfamily N-acetyltransferase